MTITASNRGHFSLLIPIMILSGATNPAPSYIFSFSRQSSAPHLGCLSNEQDIPEEVGSSEEQLNSSAGGNQGVLLMRLTCKSWNRCGTESPAGTQRPDGRWSTYSYAGHDPLVSDCLRGLNNHLQRSQNTDLFTKLQSCSRFIFSSFVCFLLQIMENRFVRYHLLLVCLWISCKEEKNSNQWWD